MNTEEIKKTVIDEIDRCSKEVLEMVKDIGHHPELGFREVRTSGLIAGYLRSCGYDVKDKLALTGVKAKLKNTGEPVRNIAVLGELDGIVCRESPLADPVSGATHTCGHNLQLGILMLVAKAMKSSGIGDALNGNVTFFAVSAEEYIELGYREELKREGKIKYFGGKQELVRLGEFDDIDAALMVHAESDLPGPTIGIYDSGTGFNSKQVQYIGKAAHAAAYPHEGINALNAAISGINAINAMRETFKDEEHSRVHFIITKGGESVNSVPADVRLEAYVRSSTIDGIQDVSRKFDRAFKAGGDAVGATTHIKTLPGYLPLVCNPDINGCFAANARQFMTEKQIIRMGHFKASTDMGDISHLMPAIHATAGGTKGFLHAANFEVTDYESAVVIPAKIIARTLVDLLTEQPGNLSDILKDYKPVLSKNEYLDLLNSFISE
ncbi:amidohydrolase [Parabacteroides bouchesdurhonensis]|uniref:amidohydrolase n=1 Tax=Parabacteroides bouchesdurhonensis TaxID=1936995 RepID=UPI000C841E0F|nr:amidohydrolase [Parabacteroides bouchesdurhonensis]